MAKNTGIDWSNDMTPTQQAREALEALLEGSVYKTLQGETAWHIKVMPSNAALDKARAALAALQAAPAVPAWMPIESAPKDGSMFLCWVSAVRYGETDEGQQYQQDASQADFARWCESEHCGYFDAMCGQIGDAQDITHWMPLPAAPKEQAEQPAAQAVETAAPAGWRFTVVSDGDIRAYAPDGETWLLREGQDGFYGFVHKLAAALAAPAAQAQPLTDEQIDARVMAIMDAMPAHREVYRLVWRMAAGSNV